MFSIRLSLACIVWGFFPFSFLRIFFCYYFSIKHNGFSPTLFCVDMLFYEASSNVRCFRTINQGVTEVILMDSVDY